MGGMIAPPEQRQLARFDGIERAVHWTNATLFLILLTTASALYVGPVSTLVGPAGAGEDDPRLHRACSFRCPCLFGLAAPGAGRSSGPTSAG